MNPIPETIQKINHIDRSIDRIRISLPVNCSWKLLERCKLDSDTKTVAHVHGYVVTRLTIQGSLLTLTLPKDYAAEHRNPRGFLQLLQPDTNIQTYVKNILTEFCRLNPTFKQFNCCINQIEIAYDIHLNDPDDLYDVTQFFTRHSNLKYSRPDSTQRIFSTHYLGKGGNIRSGSKGIRIYPKTIDGETFLRVELQVNRPFLSEKNISIDQFPLSSHDFNLFDHIEFLDNFLREGSRCLARSIMRKRGCTPVSDKNYPYRLNARTHVLNQYISRGFTPGHEDKTTVPEQLSRISKVKNLKVRNFHPKKFCQFDADVKGFLAALVRDSP